MSFASKSQSTVDKNDDLFFKVNDFSLIDQTGRIHQFSRMTTSKYLFFYSYSIGCPIARKNIPAINLLSRKFKKTDVKFYYLDSATQDTRDLINEEVNSFHIDLPILLDDTQEIARQLHINRTGEAIILDSKTLKILFRGPLDDRQTYTSEKAVASHNYAQDALSSLIRKKKIKNRYINSLGCAITIRPRMKVNFFNDIAPILEKKCASCHQAQEIPPTNFFNYENAKHWSTMIKEVIQTERMPPWEVDSVFPVINQKMLTSAEKESIYSWIDIEMPMGKIEDFKEKSEDNAVTPKESEFNFSWQQKSSVKIKANDQNLFHHELLDVNNEDDYWISSINTHAELSSKGIIQHSALFIASSDLNFSNGEFSPLLNLDKIYNVIPLPNRNFPLRFNKNKIAYRIPKGARVYLETHFAKTGRDEEARVKIIMEKSKERGNLKEAFHDARLSLRTFQIPPNTESFTLKKEITFDSDVSIYELAPHMHLRGTFGRLYIQEPESNVSKLVFSSRYIFKNRLIYKLVEPIKIKKGTIVRAELEYDNSSGNLANIDFRKNVYFGEDANKNEMMIMHLFYTKD